VPKIAISYRRADTEVMAGRIRDRLVDRFGRDAVFMDIDNIPFGKDFRVHILEAVAQSDILLVIVGQRWLGTGRGGSRGIDLDTDFVRLEVETALSNAVPIIPVLVGTARMPQPAQLPESLKNFAFLNAAPVDTGRDFHLHMERLIRSIDQTLSDSGAHRAFRDLPLAPELVVIPAGEFMMGSTDEEEGGFENERPRHRVTIARRFAIGRYPVTFDEYDRFCQATEQNKPEDRGWGRGRRPVINVSWDDAQDYLAWLSQETGRTYRVPSEAEWEYACRAGPTSRYSFGDAITPKNANYADSGLRHTSEVGAYAANPWGLHDMHGNLWKWVEDNWHENYPGAPTDGSAWKETKVSADSRLCVLRGGSWIDLPGDCRSAYRVRDLTVGGDLLCQVPSGPNSFLILAF
jgi:formylglycine-generating enzyme required for sulfatase activity